MTLRKLSAFHMPKSHLWLLTILESSGLEHSMASQDAIEHHSTKGREERPHFRLSFNGTLPDLLNAGLQQLRISKFLSLYRLIGLETWP